MAKQKAHYWKKSYPQNPIPLEGGGFFEVEIVDQNTGIAAVVDPNVQKELVTRLGTYGLEQIDKEAYDGLKKNRSSSYLKPQQREEIGGVRPSTNPDQPPRPIDVNAVVEKDSQAEVFAEAGKALPLPEDYKPTASKRSKRK